MDTPRTMTSKIEPETHPHSSAYACGSLQNNGTLHASQKHTEACVLLANHALCKDAITPKATATRMQPPRTAQRDVVVCCGVIVRFFLSAFYRGEPNSTELGKKIIKIARCNPDPDPSSKGGKHVGFILRSKRRGSVRIDQAVWGKVSCEGTEGVGKLKQAIEVDTLTWNF